MVQSFPWSFYTFIFIDDFKTRGWPNLEAYLVLTKSSLQAFPGDRSNRSDAVQQWNKYVHQNFSTSENSSSTTDH